jgi:hypothetical protein
MRDLRFSQRCCWRFKPSGMLRHVDWLNRCSEGHLQGQAVHSSWTASLWRWKHYSSSRRRGIYQSTRRYIPEDLNLQKLRDVSLLICSRTYWYRCSVRHSLRNKKGEASHETTPPFVHLCPDISDRNILSNFLEVRRGNSFNKTRSKQGHVSRKSADSHVLSEGIN